VSERPFVIALDGPAASGKSTVGLGVARQRGLRYFDTGLLYRALTWLALESGTLVEDGDAVASLIDELDITLSAEGHIGRRGQDLTPSLHTPRVDGSVSVVSAHPHVRARMVGEQRALIQPPGIVLAGRDIGTVIAPEAQLKIWLIASVEERARRRARQTGEPLQDVLDGMRRRDQIDGSRAVAPMARAEDAVDVETDGLPAAAVIDHIAELARSRGARAHASA
jgi:cytidylate kinase